MRGPILWLWVPHNYTESLSLPCGATVSGAATCFLGNGTCWTEGKDTVESVEGMEWWSWSHRAVAEDDAYLAYLERVCEEFDEHMRAEGTWYEKVQHARSFRPWLSEPICPSMGRSLVAGNLPVRPLAHACRPALPWENGTRKTRSLPGSHNAASRVGPGP